jgi:transposase
MTTKTIYGLDLAKRVFQLYWVEPETGEVVNRRFSRSSLIRFFSNRPAGTIALEACGSAHWWARKLGSLGHEPKLLHARFVRPFVQNNKTDAADAKAIWTAIQQPEVRTVAVKTEEQQAILGLHRMRSNLVKSRTAQVNQLRGLLYEFGVTLRGGRQAGLQQIRERMAELEELLPSVLFGELSEQLARVSQLNIGIKNLEQRIAAWCKQDPGCQAVLAVPGIGVLSATALVATIGDANTFKSGRELAAFIGLVPRQSGTGGLVRLGSISKRGEPYLRTLLIHGARAVAFTAKNKSPWAESLLERRPTNVAVVGMANKITRTVWAVLAHNRQYKRDCASTAA